MPFICNESWRAHLFEHIKCPEDVFIPIEDCDAWIIYPEHRWVYNKLEIALAQDLNAAPHGVFPPKTSYPVFSKPLMNFKGMGTGSRVIPDEATFIKTHQPGHFWCTLLKGRHVSTDAAFVDGKMVWSRHTTGVQIGDGMFDYWHLHKEAMPEIDDWCSSWASKHLTGYTGMANFETIGGKIIEMHLRFSPQWVDLYGDRWLNAVVRLFTEKVWEFDDSDRIDQYSVILWGSQQRSYRLPPAAEISRAAAVPGVSTVQVVFYENVDPTTTSNPPFDPPSNPPGGFRLTVVNSHDLEAGRKATKILREAIKEFDIEPHVNGVTGRAA
ncbi:hypothetical protein CPC16_005183 [Podila verticillata]|nr:hypothetical protein BGZ52_002038 [Haplosporangium bisporale]KAF9368596.1 hypothetical protein CPC16_005183 [Podila verticillata]KAI9236967.1 MAG: hypothetical protein BYD32DRAFT_5877 [Podila humilis]